MSGEQLLFDLPIRKTQGRADFFVASANELALRRLDDWPGWAGGKMVLIGPEGAGKSHLAAIWAGETGAAIVHPGALEDAKGGAVVVEDAHKVAGDAAAEEALFHLHNRVLAAGHPLLMTAREAPALWGVRLPDLASRLEAADLVRLGPPDDALLAALLVKFFDERQLQVEPDVIGYLLPRIGRTFTSAAKTVAQLDRAALRSKKPVTVRFASAVLRESAGHDGAD